MGFRITRVNPRTGAIELPWRNREGLFVLGDPAHGAQKHHDRLAVKVTTIEKVAELVRRGFSVRMTDGRNAPSLITPGSLLIEEIEHTEPVPLFVETAPKPPFEKEAMMMELRRVMLAQANQIAHGGSRAFAAAFIGFETDSPCPYCEDDPARVDLARFNATGYLDLAYDYAFQVGQYWRFGDEEARELTGFLRGANAYFSNRNPSPLANPDGLCRRAAETAFGRWKLQAGHNLTVRELTLLGRMKEAAVRNSLSKERIAIERGEVENAVAAAWLRPRRDFTPTRLEESHKERWAAHARALLERRGFAEGFMSVLVGYEITADQLATKAGVSSVFVKALQHGTPTLDLDALRRVGEVLDLDAPHFVGVAVQAALRHGT